MIPSIEFSLITLSVIVTLRFVGLKLTALNSQKEVGPMKSIIWDVSFSLLETVWAIGASFLAGILPS
jgi:hypothetical protein